MRRLLWFLAFGRCEHAPLRMQDVNLEDRIWREQRLPVHEQRTDADNGSSSRRTWTQ